jgi:RimJ/RimL family protein N-acetyltransferase
VRACGELNPEMNFRNDREWTDGVIFLCPLGAEEAAEHLAGEDEQMAKWLSGGRSTLANVQKYIADNQENWRRGAPRRAFGVFDHESGRLIGSVEVNLAHHGKPGEMNISCGIFREWRRRGMAQRTLELMGEYLRVETDVRQMVLRIAPENQASIKMAEKAGFECLGGFEEPEGLMMRYRKEVA